MLELDKKERYLIKKFFNTNGWVLNFNTQSLNDFTYQSIGIKLCEKYGLSKGKSLEKFIDEANTKMIVRLADDLIEHYEIVLNELPPDMVKREKYEEVKKKLQDYSFLSHKVNDIEYLENLMSVKKYDVFVSHATKDKLVAVNDLKNELMAIGADVWYDSDCIDWGGSLSKTIDDGLKNCEFGLVVISKNFFDRPWCEKELESLAERSIKDNKIVLLPLLLDISVHTAIEKYSFLEDIKMIEYKKGNEKDIAFMFAKILIKRLKSR